MFNDTTLAEFKAQLLQQQQELTELADTNKAAAETVELDQSMVGRLSRTDALQAQAMSVKTQRRRTLELQNIKAALIRIEQGSFGYCTKCEDEIALKRLHFNPATPLCIDCAAST